MNEVSRLEWIREMVSDGLISPRWIPEDDFLQAFGRERTAAEMEIDYEGDEHRAAGAAARLDAIERGIVGVGDGHVVRLSSQEVVAVGKMSVDRFEEWVDALDVRLLNSEVLTTLIPW